MVSNNKFQVTTSSHISIDLILLCFITLGESASINVTLSNHNVQNGTSMIMTAAFNPTLGDAKLNDVECGYTQPDGSGFTRITKYNSFLGKIDYYASFPVAERSRVNITSSGNPAILTISPVTFDDEKRLFYCILISYDNAGASQNIESQKLPLENVYSIPTVNDARSIQQSTTLTEGIAANLTCVATGRPQTNITWQYNSAIINANSSNAYAGSPLITATSVLTIYNPTRSLDGQQITCFINHPFSSTIKRTTTLRVYSLGESASVNVTLSNHNIQNGESMNLTAVFNPTIGDVLLSDLSCRYTPPGGSVDTRLTKYNPVLKKITFDSTFPSSEQSRINILSSGNTMILTISGITFDDEKKSFYCHLVYYDKLGNFQTMDSDKQILENVYSMPTVNNESSIQQSTTLTEGIAANLTCVATGRPQSNITWQYNSAIISANNSNAYAGSPLITATSVLTIHNPTQSMDGQKITCFIPHPFSSTINRTTTLRVYSSDKPDQVKFEAPSLKPTTGSPVTLTCTARASPPANFRFIMINESSTKIVQDGASTNYTISSIDYKKYNNYTASYGCMAYNSFGSSSMQTVVLDIQVPPSITFAITPNIVNEGQNATIECKVNAANPTPSSVIIFDNNGLGIFHVGGKVELTRITRSQTGTYTCMADNGMNLVFAYANLTVYHGPQFMQNNTEYERCIGESVQIVCNAVGKPHPDVSLYLNGVLLKRNSRNLTYDVQLNAKDQFGRYICVANNIVGTVNITTKIIDKPSGNVTNIKLSVTDNTIRVSWDLPPCSSNIQEIKAQYRKKGQSTWPLQVVTATPSDKEITIKGLESGVEYEVRVVVVDIGGREYKTNVSGAVKIDSKADSASSSSSSAEIAISIIVPLLIVIIVGLLIWNFRLKRQVASVSNKTNVVPDQNIQAHYMDIELNNVNTEAQSYATITNPGALTYEKIPEVKTQYMELNTHREGDQTYSKLTKGHEEVGKN